MKSNLQKIIKLILVTVIVIVIFGITSNVDAAVIRKPANNLGLLGYWSFDEGTGTQASDLSGQAKDGTLTNGPTWVNGRRGGAVNLDGSNDYVHINDAIDPTSYTISMWVKPNSTANQSLIVRTDSCGPSCSFSHQLMIVNGFFRHYTYNGGTPVVTGTTNVVAGTWYHVVGVYNASGNMSLYVNGVSEGTPVATSGTLWTGGDRYYVGSSSGGGYGYLNGAVDDVRIYNRALSTTEIANLYGAGAMNHVNGNTLGLVAHWPLDEGSGTTAKDRSGQGNTGILFNGPTWGSGKFNNAVTFDGSNDVITASSSDALNLTQQVTLSAWIKTTGGSGTYRNIAGKMATNNSWGQPYARYNIRLNGSNQVEFWINDGANTNNYVNSGGTTIAADGNWKHVVATYDGSYERMYVDGVQYGTTTISGAILTSSGDFFIGKEPIGEAFTGMIDDVRVYNRGLTSAEVAKLFAETSPASKVTMNASQNNKMTDNLLSVWSYDGRDVSGTTAYDRKNSRNGTMTNGPVPTIGKVGQAMLLDGVNDYIGASGFTELGTTDTPYSFAGWVKVSSGAGNGNIVHMSSQSDAVGWCLPPVAYVSGKIQAYSWNNGGVSTLGTTTLQTETWYHFAVTWDSTNGLRVFVNGVLENTSPMSSYTASGSSNYLWIGRSPGGCAGDAGWFKGAVDDMRVYNKSLTADEVKQLYLIGK